MTNQDDVSQEEIYECVNEVVKTMDDYVESISQCMQVLAIAEYRFNKKASMKAVLKNRHRDKEEL